MSIQPLYLPGNCQAAYQLNWALSVFGKQRLPSPATAIDALRAEVDKDQVKILEFQFRPPNVAIFFLSSQPHSSPAQLVRSIKGRWHFQPQTWQAFERYAMRDRPPAEVAEELGMSLNSVLLAKSRILRRLREEAKGMVEES